MTKETRWRRSDVECVQLPGKPALQQDDGAFDNGAKLNGFGSRPPLARKGFQFLGNRADSFGELSNGA